MDTVQVNVYTQEEATDLGLVTPKFLADFLMVPAAQVSAWATRRRASGYPDAAGFTRRGDSLVPVYDFAQTVEWYTHYEPVRGRPFTERPQRVQTDPQGTTRRPR